MAFDEALAQRLRQALTAQSPVSERKMMGALCFMVHGHMCCGVTGTSLMVRVGPAGQDEALAQPHTRPMHIGSRPATGFVLVDKAAVGSDTALNEWLQRGLDFIRTLPPKANARSVT